MLPEPWLHGRHPSYSSQGLFESKDSFIASDAFSNSPFMIISASAITAPHLICRNSGSFLFLFVDTTSIHQMMASPSCALSL